jgi:hypothetical protein
MLLGCKSDARRVAEVCGITDKTSGTAIIDMAPNGLSSLALHAVAWVLDFSGW